MSAQNPKGLEVLSVVDNVKVMILYTSSDIMVATST